MRCMGLWTRIFDGEDVEVKKFKIPKRLQNYCDQEET
jgi:hypothetical protein